MKKFSILFTTLVLTLSVMAGCGCRNSKPAATTAPTTMPTMPSVTTVPTTQATTMPTTVATDPTNDTVPHGNAPLGTDDTTATEATGTDAARSRSGGMVGGIGSGSGITGSITG